MLWRQLVPAILWSLLIIVFSVLPARQLRQLQVDYLWTSDKLAHAVVYAVLAFLLSVGLRKQYERFLLRHYHLMIAFLISISYGLLLELLQDFMTMGRAGSLYDQLANMAGAVVGILACILIFGKAAQPT